MHIIATVFSFIIFSFFSLTPIYANTYANPANSSIATSVTSVPADGATTATITVTVKDSQKNPRVGDHVKITSSTDTGIVINGGPVGTNHYTAATDSNGKAIFRVSSRNISPGTVTFTVSDTSDLPPTTLGTVRITFTPASLAPDPSCHDSAPTNAPVLQSAISMGANHITLTWTKAADPVNYYLIAYGTASGDYIYGNPNVGGNDTTSYSVGGLVTGTTYYFVVRAGNGCAPGSYSNELAATVGGIKPTHTPTPTQSQNPPAGGTPTPINASISNIPKAPPLTTNISDSKNAPSPLPIIFTLLVLCIGVLIYSKRKRW